MIETVRRRLAGASNQRIALAVANTAIAILFFIANLHAGAYGWSALFGTISVVGLATVATMVRSRSTTDRDDRD
jgi:hypothetical protein